MAKCLYKLDANGSIQQWTIGGVLQDEEILITYGQVGGALQQQRDKISTNNSGRSMKEQMLLEMRARITRQKAKGYRDTIEEAKAHKNQNALNLAKPMLAQQFDKVKGVNFEHAWRQHKYDGHRMLVHNDGDRLIAYSRNGKAVDTMDHILRGLNIPDGGTIDGELYHHGTPLQTIASWAKRLQPNTLKLRYVVYDMISPAPFIERYEQLTGLYLGPGVDVARTWQSTDPIVADLHASIDQGYEGLILRHGNLPYGSGKRCKSLVKVKHAYDNEFVVVGVEESKDGWGVLVCMTGEGKEFRVSAPGSIPEKKAILENAAGYIGLLVTVEYFSLTKERIPFHPVAIRFREDI